MNYAYVASDNSTSDAQVLGAQGQDIYVRKIVFGTPANGKIIRFYNSRVATGHASGIASVSGSNLAMKITQPTAAAGLQIRNEQDFEDAPLQLDGGSFHTDGSDVTVIWEVKDEAVQ